MSSDARNGSDDATVTGHVIQNVVHAVFLLVVIILAGLGNFSVLYMIGRNFQMRTVTNAIIAALSVSDLIAVGFSMPAMATALLTDTSDFSAQFCVGYASLNQVHAMSSCSMVMLIAVDRMMAIVRPAGKNLTPVTCAILISALWFATILFSMPWTLLLRESSTGKTSLQYCLHSYHGNTSLQGQLLNWARLIVCHFAPMTIMCYCVATLWRTIRTGQRRISPATVEPRFMIFHSELRTASTVIILVAGYVVCWLPYLTVATIRASSASLPGAAPLGAEDSATQTLAWINTAVNPVLYAYRNPHVAKFLKLRRRHRNPSSSQNFTNIQGRLTPKITHDGRAVSTEQIHTKFDWTIVSRSPVHLIMCTARKNSDFEAFATPEDNSSQSTTI